jgi:hypothetical protein
MSEWYQRNLSQTLCRFSWHRPCQPASWHTCVLVLSTQTPNGTSHQMAKSKAEAAGLCAYADSVVHGLLQTPEGMGRLRLVRR